jgi:hypothetical protein
MLSVAAGSRPCYELRIKRCRPAPSLMPAAEKGGQGTPPAKRSTPWYWVPSNSRRSPSMTSSIVARSRLHVGTSLLDRRFAGWLWIGVGFVLSCRPISNHSAITSGAASTRQPCRSRRVLGPSPSVGLLPLLLSPTATALAAPSRSSPQSTPPSRSAGHRLAWSQYC